jgi:hypothetical protein
MPDKNAVGRELIQISSVFFLPNFGPKAAGEAVLEHNQILNKFELLCR